MLLRFELVMVYSRGMSELGLGDGSEKFNCDFMILKPNIEYKLIKQVTLVICAKDDTYICPNVLFSSQGLKNLRSPT